MTKKLLFECVCGQTFLTEKGRNNHQKKCLIAKSFAEEEKEEDKKSDAQIEIDKMQEIANLFKGLSNAGKTFIKDWISRH